MAHTPDCDGREHSDFRELIDRIGKLDSGQAEMGARLTGIENVLNEHRADDKRRAERLEEADERRTQALLIADEKRADALATADAERAKILEKNHLRLARLEAEVATSRGLRRHIVSVVLAVLTSVVTAWTVFKIGLGGGDK
jgi:hypothetical protein